MDLICFLKNLFISLLIYQPLVWTDSNQISRISTKCGCGLTNDHDANLDDLVARVNDPNMHLNDIDVRIVGGSVMKPHKYPWMTILLFKNYYHCGGSVINNYYILSAAHCVFTHKGSQTRQIKPNEFIAILGVYDRENFDESSRQYHGIANILYPKRINECRLHDIHDVALLKTRNEIEFTFAVSPVCLPKPTLFEYAGANITISGWGIQGTKAPLSEYPLEISETILSDQECLAALNVGYHYAENPNAMFCAYKTNSDACKGDSGGPVTTVGEDRVIQIGVVSWGIDCAKQSHPGVFTKLPHYVKWILENTEDATYCGL